MSLKFALSVVLFAAALPAVAQPPAASPPPAESAPPQANAIQAAAQAFGGCIRTGVQGLPASTTPDAGAASVFTGCAPQHAALVQAVNAMIATLPADQRAAAQAQADSQLAQAEIQSSISRAIAQHRSAAAAPAAPAQPAPAATPH